MPWGEILQILGILLWTFSPKSIWTHYAFIVLEVPKSHFPSPALWDFQKVS